MSYVYILDDHEDYDSVEFALEWLLPDVDRTRAQWAVTLEAAYKDKQLVNVQQEDIWELEEEAHRRLEHMGPEDLDYHG